MLVEVSAEGLQWRHRGGKSFNFIPIQYSFDSKGGNRRSHIGARTSNDFGHVVYTKVSKS